MSHLLAVSGTQVGVYFGLGIIGYVLFAMAYAGIFKKADQPVWPAFVPVVNIFFLLKVVGRPGWWLILFFIPCVSFVIFIVLMLDLARAFGKGAGWAIGLIILPFIFMLILGFGQARYEGPVATG